MEWNHLKLKGLSLWIFFSLHLIEQHSVLQRLLCLSLSLFWHSRLWDVCHCLILPLTEEDLGQLNWWDGWSDGPSRGNYCHPWKGKGWDWIPSAPRGKFKFGKKHSEILPEADIARHIAANCWVCLLQRFVCYHSSFFDSKHTGIDTNHIYINQSD